MSQNCILSIRGAELKGKTDFFHFIDEIITKLQIFSCLFLPLEKVNSSVHVYYMDKLISRSGFSGETNSPVWNKRVIFPIGDTEEPLEVRPSTYL